MHRRLKYGQVKTDRLVVATREIVGALAQQYVDCMEAYCGMPTTWDSEPLMAFSNTSAKILLGQRTH